MNDDVKYLDWRVSTVLQKDSNNLYNNRKEIVDIQTSNNQDEVTVFVLAYGNFEKTKMCIKYLLEHTSDIPHKLVLVDYGNEDDGKTLEFFKLVQHPNKEVISININHGIALAIRYITNTFHTKYYALVSNDVYVTKNWLNNSLKCIKSDEHIGVVTAMSSNTSNYQAPNLIFETLDEMQIVAESFNVSNPNKWMEKRRLITLFMLVTREVLNLVSFDEGFAHNFADDDFSVAVNRAGYKQILCGDIFIHHDHSFSERDSGFQRILNIGRENFKEKYFGLDAWIDFLNYEVTLINHGEYTKHYNEYPNILGIDIKCGIPLYEIKNNLRKNECAYDSNLYAFTTEAKYFCDLQNVCYGKVKCDRIDYISDEYQNNSFDYIILGDPINKYKNPLKLIKNIINLLAPDGQALIKLKNIVNINKFRQMLGNSNMYMDDIYTQLCIDDLMTCIKSVNSTEIRVITSQLLMKPTTRELINKDFLATDNESSISKNIYVDEYFLCIKKL